MEFDQLQITIENATLGNGLPALGTSAGDLTGVELQNVPARSACAQMKWIAQNSGYRFKPFFELDYEDSIQGIRIYDSNDELVFTVSVPVTGGEDSDPAKQITRDMYTIISEALLHVQKNKD